LHTKSGSLGQAAYWSTSYMHHLVHRVKTENITVVSQGSTDDVPGSTPLFYHVFPHWTSREKRGSVPHGEPSFNLEHSRVVGLASETPNSTPRVAGCYP
jgi:hypothetical protein